MGRKMKALESQMGKQQQDLSQGQRGSTWASACVWNTGVSQAEPKGVCTAFFPLQFSNVLLTAIFISSPNQGVLWQGHL